MKLEYSGKNLLFETTSLPDIFFTEFLSIANGDAVKVYLYMLFLSKYNKDIKIGDLSKVLSMPIETVKASIKFWEDVDVIIKKNNNYVLKSIQDITLNKLYKAKVTLSPEKVDDIAKNQYRAKAIDTINTTFFQGVMAPTWYNDIELWFEQYGFDEQVMVSLFQYAFDKSSLNRNYIQAVANNWQQNNIKTYSDLEIYDQKRNNFNKIKKDISKKMGLSRNLTTFEEAYIEQWINEYNFNMDIIDIALKQTTSKTNPNLKYVHSLLTNWHNIGLDTTDDIEKYLQQNRQKKSVEKSLPKNDSFNSYSQRTYDNLDFVYTNIPKAEA